RKRFHSALALFGHARQVDPLAPEPRDGITRIRRTGGSDVAVADVYAGGDPDFGKTEKWIREHDAEHQDWKNAWTHETTNYRYRTNAGFRVLMTSAIAMENVNRFYRRFFHFKEKGEKIPKIEIRIFKNRDEYLTLGRNPVKWSGGHFIGNAVETFVGGVTGTESIRRMYGTLFHEAAHHFVSMTSPRCPGWLNEAYASFFEGTDILSNGSVRWNRVPNHRLFPMAARLEAGWMKDPTEGIKADGTGNPTRAPTFRMVVEGKYRWGPPWYAPTWALVYFLFNYRDEDGRLVYREALSDYYYSHKGRRPRDPVAHFEELVLSCKRSPARRIDALSGIWKDWLLGLRDQQIGRIEKASSLLELALRAEERKDLGAALEFYEEARLADPHSPDVLYRLGLLEQRRRRDRAAALYRDFRHELELRGSSETDPRYILAGKRAEALDPLVQAYKRLKADIAKEGVAIARSYQQRGLPLMALSIAKQMSGSFSMPSALDLYREIALATGKSLARWRLAYNERNLEGWSDDGDGSYQAYGRRIRAFVRDDPSIVKRAGGFVTRALTCDVTFESDYSLEAEVMVEQTGGTDEQARIVGLCFARKDSQNFLALNLHPRGYLDLAQNHGGVWEILDHRQPPLAEGWHRLRIDIAGKTCDYYLDGLYLRSYEFPAPDVLRGGFGLLTGLGKAFYRHIRLLTREAGDPGSRIERELAMARIARDASLRGSYNFAGSVPPPLDGGSWVLGHAFDPRRPGWPTALLFWTKNQEKQIPTLAYARHLAKTYHPLGLRVILIAGDGIGPAELGKILGTENPLGLHVLADDEDKLFGRYGLKVGGFGLPRALLIDLDGKASFEGDLGLKIGSGWKGQTTYLDDALKKLIEIRRLDRLKELVPALREARSMLRNDLLKEAVAKLRPLAELPVDPAVWVVEARELLEKLRASQGIVMREAEKLIEAGYPLRAGRLLDRICQTFQGEEPERQAAPILERLRKTSSWRRSNGAWKILLKAREWQERGRKRADVLKLLNRARKVSPTVEIEEEARRIEQLGGG
ncbi:MAG: hypothetical protein ACE5F1_05415, partial [Planctomycetota bacterium]